MGRRPGSKNRKPASVTLEPVELPKPQKEKNDQPPVLPRHAILAVPGQRARQAVLDHAQQFGVECNALEHFIENRAF